MYTKVEIQKDLVEWIIIILALGIYKVFVVSNYIKGKFTSNWVKYLELFLYTKKVKEINSPSIIIIGFNESVFVHLSSLSKAYLFILGFIFVLV